MSTAVLNRPRVKPKKITVPLVRVALEEIALAAPRRADRRCVDELPPRYVHWGAPACLVARVLTRLGFSIGILKALDAEHPVGDLWVAGVRIEESRHPALKRIDANAKELLAWVQREQDRGRAWGHIVRDAFASKRAWIGTGLDRRRRPWLY